jgi:hypothetical protein
MAYEVHMEQLLNVRAGSRGSSVNIVTEVGLDDRCSIPGRDREFLFARESRPPLGEKQLHIQLVQGVLPSGVKRPGRETDHSPPSSARLRKRGATLTLLHTS